MAGLDELVAVLRGGSRDGESTTVGAETVRLYAASEPPGLVDVYEATDEQTPLRGNDDPATVFVFVGQEPASDLAPDATHLPAMP